MKSQNLGANPNEPTKCREFDNSFHVNYTIDDNYQETENVTHQRIVDSDKIEERGDTECGWVAQFEGTYVQLLMSDYEENGWAIEHKLSALTCEQLSDMFARAAVVLREREVEATALLAAEERRRAEEAARQHDLPL